MPAPVNIGSQKSKSPAEGQMKISPLEKHFDPYDHGMEDGYGMWGAVVHIIRLTFGAGIFLLPYAMKTVGYVNGTILLALVSILYYHSMHILISHEYRLCKLLQVKQITYSSLIEKTFENAPYPLNKFGTFISQLALLYFCITAYTSTYLFIFASSVRDLAEHFNLFLLQPHFVITLIMVPILIIICRCRRLLKTLVPFSAITNIISLVMAIVLVTRCIMHRNPAVTVRPFGDLNLNNILQTIAIYFQALICTSSLLPVKNYMKQPRHLGATFGALNISALVITVFYISFALVPYFCFGDNVYQNILWNLSEGNFLFFFTSFLLAIAMFVIYLVSISVIFDNIWPEVERNISENQFKIVIEWGIRIGINIWAYLLAVGILDLSIILTVCGTLAIVFEVALIPGLELTLALKSNRKPLLTIFKDLAIIIICAILLYSMSFVDWNVRYIFLM